MTWHKLADALAQKLNLKWVQVNDKYGIDPALWYGETSILTFPLTHISKRFEGGEKIDVYYLFNELEKAVERMIADKEII